METELKIEIDDAAPVRAKLVELGATRIGEVVEENVYFDRDDELSTRGESLRLRKDDRIRLTWKGPSRFEDGVVERPEIEVTLSSFADAADILDRLGFSLAERLAKRRETWRLPGVEVAIDSLAFGTFVEIEGPADLAQATAWQLGLDYQQGLGHSYRSLQRRRARDG